MQRFPGVNRSVDELGYAGSGVRHPNPLIAKGNIIAPPCNVMKKLRVPPHLESKPRYERLAPTGIRLSSFLPVGEPSLIGLKVSPKSGERVAMGACSKETTEGAALPG
jgi:hypothetical protein